MSISSTHSTTTRTSTFLAPSKVKSLSCSARELRASATLISLCSRTGDPGLKKFYTRLKLWWEDASSQCSGHWSRYVCNIGVVELTSLTDSKHLFLNKVRRDVSPLAYECLTQWHRNRTRSSNESNLDFNFYKTLRFVRNHV